MSSNSSLLNENGDNLMHFKEVTDKKMSLFLEEPLVKHLGECKHIAESAHEKITTQ